MMRLTPASILEIWESGRDTSPIERSLLLLQSVKCGTNSEELSHLSLGQRDALLLEMYGCNFGSTLVAKSQCSRCTIPVELETNICDLLAQAPLTNLDSAIIEVDSYRVECRVPMVADFASVVAANMESNQFLVENCITHVQRDGDLDSFSELPDVVLNAVERKLAEMDPLSEVQLAIECPECGHSWSEMLDVVDFVWSEIERAASRLLHEIHALGSAFGWSEEAILKLSDPRRRAYLELVCA